MPDPAAAPVPDPAAGPMPEPVAAPMPEAVAGPMPEPAAGPVAAPAIEPIPRPACSTTPSISVGAPGEGGGEGGGKDGDKGGDKGGGEGGASTSVPPIWARHDEVGAAHSCSPYLVFCGTVCGGAAWPEGAGWAGERVVVEDAPLLCGGGALPFCSFCCSAAWWVIA
jgi:hypothetical protein